jgi:hypothetical protein
MNIPNRTIATVLTEEDTAIFLKVTPFALRKWRRQGCGPRFIRCGARLVRYSTSDLDVWIEQNKFTSAANELHRKSK